MCIFNKTYFCYWYATKISYFIGLLTICTVLVPMDQNVYVLYAGGPNFAYFTTVIAISCEADYLLNRWTYRNRGSNEFIIFNFKQLSLLAKIDQTSGYGDIKPPKS